MTPDRPPASGRGAAVFASYALLILFGSLLFGWIMSCGFTTVEPHTDFRFHTAVARRLATGGRLEVPHPLFHWLTVAVYRLHPGVDFRTSGFVAALAAQVALLVVTLRWLLGVFPRTTGGIAAIAAVLTLALSLVDPLNQLTPAPREFYFGYVFPNTFHNPTGLVLRPLALALFLFCTRTWSGPATPARLAGAALLTLACGLAKPNELICLIPAIGVVWVLDLLRPSWRSGALVPWLGIVVPGVILLAWQAWFTLRSGSMEPASVVWDPFAVVFELTQRDLPRLGLKVLMSVLFPLAVLLGYGRAATGDRSLRLAWITFFFGLVYTYGLAETGSRHSNGNFLWSGQVTLFVLFAVSLHFVVRQAADAGRSGGRKRLAACAAVFALHLVSGVLYAVNFARTGRAY